jgi:hypothetical protein
LTGKLPRASTMLPTLHIISFHNVNMRAIACHSGSLVNCHLSALGTFRTAISLQPNLREQTFGQQLFLPLIKPAACSSARRPLPPFRRLPRPSCICLVQPHQSTRSCLLRPLLFLRQLTKVVSLDDGLGRPRHLPSCPCPHLLRSFRVAWQRRILRCRIDTTS